MIAPWRIIKEKYLSQALSGEGARLGGGRWNHRGIPVVYGSETLSLAVLELFIHFTRKDMAISRSLLAIPLLIPESMKVTEVSLQGLPQGWDGSPPPDFTRDMGTAWTKEGASAVMRAPSAIIPEERNYVLNVNHPDFALITIGEPRPFALDKRIWKQPPGSPVISRPS